MSINIEIGKEEKSSDTLNWHFYINQLCWDNNEIWYNRERSDDETIWPISRLDNTAKVY